MSDQEPFGRGLGDKAVSVVIPCYRNDDTIVGAVQSALAQNNGRLRVIVVIDDGSLETKQMLEALEDRSITVLVNEANIGAAASRNRGLVEVTTPYVSFLDADDYLHGNLTGPLVRKMRAEGADVGFGPSVQWIPGRGLCNGWIPSYRDHADVFLQWLSSKQNVNTCSVMWSADYLRRIGGWDPEAGRNDDGELALRAMLLGAKFVLSTEGAGVWSNDRSQTRITTSNENLSTLLNVADKFLAMRSPVVSDEVRVQACAFYLYRVAHMAYSRGANDLAAKALERSRELGFEGHLGSRIHIAASTLLGLPLKQKVTRLIRGLRAGG